MKTSKTAKTYRECPLFLLQTGQWAKKVRGHMRYIGIDRDTALAK